MKLTWETISKGLALLGFGLLVLAVMAPTILKECPACLRAVPASVGFILIVFFLGRRAADKCRCTR